MKNGSIKIVSDVEKGDILMGPDSMPRIVKKASMCEGLAFEVKPVKVKSFILGEDNYICLSKVGTVNNLLDIHVSNFEKQSEHFKNNYKLYKSGVDFETIKDPIIDLYYLGSLLADGCLRSVPIKLSSGDIEPCQYAEKIIDALGLTSRLCSRKEAKYYDVFTGSDKKRNNLLRS